MKQAQAGWAAHRQLLHEIHPSLRISFLCSYSANNRAAGKRRRGKGTAGETRDATPEHREPRAGAVSGTTETRLPCGTEELPAAGQALTLPSQEQS